MLVRIDSCTVERHIAYVFQAGGRVLHFEAHQGALLRVRRNDIDLSRYVGIAFT
jgi:hypothetical protein